MEMPYSPIPQMRIQIQNARVPGYGGPSKFTRTPTPMPHAHTHATRSHTLQPSCRSDESETHAAAGVREGDGDAAASEQADWWHARRHDTQQRETNAHAGTVARRQPHETREHTRDTHTHTRRRQQTRGRQAQIDVLVLTRLDTACKTGGRCPRVSSIVYLHFKAMRV